MNFNTDKDENICIQIKIKINTQINIFSESVEAKVQGRAQIF